MFMFKKKAEIPSADEALARPFDADCDCARPFRLSAAAQRPIFRMASRAAMFGMGCFWGAERKFWELGEGIHSTAVGYASGHTPNPTYEEVCSGRTGHNEVVLVVYDPKKISYGRLLQTFWESHDPTQGMRQGNDTGTQYRSGIYSFTPAQRETAEASKAMYDKELEAARVRCDHHRNSGCARVLLRRGLSSAVPGEEPVGLLRARRHRSELPDRNRRQACPLRPGVTVSPLIDIALRTRASGAAPR